MNTNLLKWIGMGAGLVVVFILGFALSRGGKPYGSLLFNAHKLLALALFVYAGVLVFRMNNALSFNGAELGLLVLTAVLLGITLVSGGLQNLDKELPVLLKTLHRITPYLTSASGIGLLLLMVLRRG